MDYHRIVGLHEDCIGLYSHSSSYHPSTICSDGIARVVYGLYDCIGIE